MKMPGSVTVFVNHFFGFPKTCTKLAVLLHVFGKQVRDGAEATAILQKGGGMQAICLKKKKSSYSRIMACAKSNMRRARGIL